MSACCGRKLLTCGDRVRVARLGRRKKKATTMPGSWLRKRRYERMSGSSEIASVEAPRQSCRGSDPEQTQDPEERREQWRGQEHPIDQEEYVHAGNRYRQRSAQNHDNQCSEDLFWFDQESD